MPKLQHTNLQRLLLDAFDSTTFEILGRATGFMQRERTITPGLLIPSLVASMGSERVETMTALWHRFRADTGQAVAYKSFYDKLASAGFPVMMRQFAEHLMKRLLCRSLKVSAQSPFARFRDIVIQDGTAFGVNPKLAGPFPGTGSPAEVEIHTTMSLLSDGPRKATLTGHAGSERDFLPAPEDLKDCLLLADRGYFSYAYPAMIAERGGFFIIRARMDLGAQVLGQHKDGRFIPIGERPRVSDYVAASHEGDLDLVIRPEKGLLPPFRMVVLSTPKGRTFLLTNLPVEDFSPQMVGWAYRLRWQVELMYKEWKSHANLHRFPTANNGIAEGLIWASVAAAIVKRFVAFIAQAARSFPVSTLKAAVLLKRFITPILTNLLRDPAKALATLEEALATLESLGRRSNPKRERKRGRLKIGLLPCFQA